MYTPITAAKAIAPAAQTGLRTMPGRVSICRFCPYTLA